MQLSSHHRQSFTAARATQDMLAAFTAPPHARNSPPHAPQPTRVDDTEHGAPATADGPIREETRFPVTPSAIAEWRDVDRDVSATIGYRGTAAVLRLAIATAKRRHAWLPEQPDGSSFDVCLTSLDSVLDGQGPEEAVAGKLAVQLAFRSLLASLVGPALTEQLLDATWPVGRTSGEILP